MKDLIIGLMAAPALIGLFTFYHWFRPQHAPADRSNRINAIRLWWFALTREEYFAPYLSWLRNDEADNLPRDET